MSNADDVLEMCMVREMRDVGECVKCVCVWLGEGYAVVVSEGV